VNPLDVFFAGIAPQHVPALVAGLVTAVWLAKTTLGMTTLGTTGRWRPPSVVDRWAGVLLGVSAAVHLALPLNPHHGPLVSGAFVASGAAFAVVASCALRGRSWRAAAAPVVVATLVGYLVAVGRGEEADQVGIATALVELVALGLAMVPRDGARLRRFAGGAATVVATFLVGAVVWVASIQAHAAGPSAGPSASPPSAGPSAGPADGHAHTHEHAGRTQAGVIMRPLGDAHHATDEQRRAADDLAARTLAATARYADLAAAHADGYRSGLAAAGTDVHLEHQGHKSDGVTLDPERPEMLVYAIEGGRATLLGVVFVMERAGVPGPEPGGPITRWHAHNVCLSVLPPGLGVVSPFGGCPALSVSVLTPEMMHVWVVANPSGPFAEGLDETWVRAYHAEHGRPA